MKFSESLRRGIIGSFAGGIMNGFIIKKRRITLFFEDISAEYVKACEKAGHKKELRKAGERWGRLATKTLMPDTVKKLPLPLFSKVMKHLWVNLGLLEDFRAKKTGDCLVLDVKEGAITRIIGDNSFSKGVYAGVFEEYLRCTLLPGRTGGGRDFARYKYRIECKFHEAEGKSKEEYNRLNELPPVKGLALKDALKKHIFKLDKNRIYFRGKPLCDSENTIFHIVGNLNIMLDAVPEISERYFNKIVDKDAGDEKKLLLLKTLLQTMGWGIAKIKMNSRNSIMVNLSHLPYGLQLKKDTWDFLIRTIQGYLWLINRRFKIRSIAYKMKCLRVEYRAV